MKEGSPLRRPAAAPPAGIAGRDGRPAGFAGPSAGAAWSARARGLLDHPEVADAIVPTLLVRAGLLLFGALVTVFAGHVPSTLEGWLGVWNRWDGPHYLNIAAHGYDPHGDTALIAFFPLFPALIRIASLAIPPLPAAMLISLVATLFTAIGLYRLVLLDGDRPMARRAVLFLNLFPTSLFLVAPYAESLFLALTIWSALAARRDDWRTAGILGMLAAAARVQGVLVLAVLAVEYLARRRRSARALAWIALVAVGPLVYLAINQVVFGDPFFFATVQREHFYHSFEWPWVVIGNLVAAVASYPMNEETVMVYLAPLLGYAFLALVTVWSVVSRRSRGSYAAYTLLSFGSLVTLSWPISVPRYAFGVFPALMALADVTRRRVLLAALLGASIVLLAVLTTLFVRGRWAF